LENLLFLKKKKEEVKEDEGEIDENLFGVTFKIGMSTSEKQKKKQAFSDLPFFQV